MSAFEARVFSSSMAPARSNVLHSRTRPLSSRNLVYENPGMDICVVAKHGSRHRHQYRPVSPPAHLHPWKWPGPSMVRLHLDYAGPFLGHMFLLLVDAHSKWVELFLMSSATSKATVEKLRTVFAQFGLPNTVATDNGTCFTSQEFTAFLRKNGASTPYHPSSNGLAE